MRISTRKGDSGRTGLCFGGSVLKDDPRIEACGAIDELCSYLGLARSVIRKKKVKDVIQNIQRDLFVIGSEITTKPKALKSLKSRVTFESVGRIEDLIEDIEKKNNFDGRFHISGEDCASSILDIARTVARRAERRVFVLSKKSIVKNKALLAYLNRLSDLIYLMVRRCESRHCKL